MSTDRPFCAILIEHDPKDIRSHSILRFFAEDLSEFEKTEFVSSIFESGSWILPTEISSSSGSIELKNYTKEKFHKIFDEWAIKRIEFSVSLKNEIRNFFIPINLLVEFREALFSVRNLDFPIELMSVFEKLVCESNSNYLNNYFENSFWLVIEEFNADEIEIFFTYFSNLYVKNNSLNLKSFLYSFLNRLAYSSKIFLLSQDFTNTLRKLSKSLKDNNNQNDYTTIISIFLIELIEKKELNLSNSSFDKIIIDSLSTLKKGEPENLDFYRFLERFNYQFKNLDFNLEANTLFENLQININLANNSDLRKKNALAQHYLKNTEKYCELLFFYLEHCSKILVNEIFIEFVRLIDELRVTFSTLLWFEEYLNFDIVKGKIIGTIPNGFNVEIEKDFFNKRVEDKKLSTLCTEEFVLQNGFGFLNFKSLKDFPKTSNFYNSGKNITQKSTKTIIDAAKISEPESFFISSVNYSSANKWNVPTFLPFNNTLSILISKYDLKAFFSSIELLLIEKAHEYLNLESPFLGKTTLINKVLYFNFNHDYKINFDRKQFWSILETIRPTLYNLIYLNHTKNEESFKKIISIYENNQIVTGLVTSMIKGGMVVEIFGKEVFLPGSQIDVKSVLDYNFYVDKLMDFRVIKVDYRSKNVVVSHKILIEEKNEILREQSLLKLEKGTVLKGRVKNITYYGVFIDLGGIDGLIHISDLSWGRIIHPDEIIKLDDEINVVILDFDENKKRITLGLKQLLIHPWDTFTKDLKVGDIVEGRVVDILNYGAFIELAFGVEGLIHISEMSWNQSQNNAHDLLNIGDDLVAVVIIFDRKDRKLSLSIKQLTSDPLFDKYAKGTKHRAIVIKVVNIGIVVQLEKGVEGFIHISKMSFIKKIKHPLEFAKVGETIDIYILSLNKETRKIGIGIVKNKSENKRIKKIN